ncbi:hypothetical protein BGX38DRAFT_1157036 [Terfezia claveryi]|nr:hypothetical protein BGX38DRAFT_1157036 [Terfezia claveryi]
MFYSNSTDADSESGRWGQILKRFVRNSHTTSLNFCHFASPLFWKVIRPSIATLTPGKPTFAQLHEQYSGYRN